MVRTTALAHFSFLRHNYVVRRSPTISIPNVKLCASLSLSLKMASWSCKRCTFLNPPSQISSCQMCLSSSSPSTQPPSPGISKWSCKACTFLNPYRNSDCQICGTVAPVSSLSRFVDFDDNTVDEEDASVGSVFFPLKRCCKRKAQHNQDPDAIDGGCVERDSFKRMNTSIKPETELDGTGSTTVSASLKILTYNVWFREDLELKKRMEALGNLILQHLPDLICFQEFTPNIYDIFVHSSWWKLYKCSISNEEACSKAYFCIQLSKIPVNSFSCQPFLNSIMGRELCIASVEAQQNIELVVATSHLESPCPAPPKWDQMYSKERVDQAKEAFKLLKKYPNVIFGGDMNWDDKLDGVFPSLSDGWVDAWVELRPGENGWTYDTKSNSMLSANRTLQKRLDRFFCKLRDFKLSAIEMIGTNEIPGASYMKEKKVRKEMKKLELPVFPSDHYGLLLTICKR